MGNILMIVFGDRLGFPLRVCGVRQNETKQVVLPHKQQTQITILNPNNFMSPLLSFGACCKDDLTARQVSTRGT